MAKFIILPVKFRTEKTEEIDKEIERLTLAGVEPTKELLEELETTATFKKGRLNIEAISTYYECADGTFIETFRGNTITSLKIEELDKLIHTLDSTIPRMTILSYESDLLKPKTK